MKRMKHPRIKQYEIDRVTDGQGKKNNSKGKEELVDLPTQRARMNNEREKRNGERIKAANGRKGDKRVPVPRTHSRRPSMTGLSGGHRQNL